MKGILKARTVAILTAFLMVFAMMPLVAFGEETPEEENAAGGSVYEEPEEGLESETVADGAAANDEEQPFSAMEENPNGTRAAHTHDNITFTEWTETTSLPNTYGNYCLTEDVTIGSTWEVPSGETTLCLNGHGIKFTGEKGSVIYVGGGKTLNIMDCNSENLTHKFTVTNGLATVNDSATGEDVETFSGGYITGGNCNTSDNNYKRGGGIYNNGILNMLGGTIIGNQVIIGGGVYNIGTFNMSGNALIEYNRAYSEAGGVYNTWEKKITMSGNAKIIHNSVDSTVGGGVSSIGEIELSGTPVISGNIGHGGPNNLNINRMNNQFYPITVVGELTEGASIGVNMSSDDGKGIIAVPGTPSGSSTPYKITESDKAKFFSDTDNLDVNLITEGENAGKLELKDKEYDLRVGGEQVTSAHLSGESNVGDKGSWTYDPETKTLTLDHYSYTSQGLGSNARQDGISGNFNTSDFSGLLTIKVIGTNTITISGNGFSAGIVQYGPLIIKGSGNDSDSLNIDVSSNYEAKGITFYSNLTIEDVTVNTVAHDCEYYSEGVFAEEGGTTLVTSGSLIATAGNVSDSYATNASYGILAGKLIVGKDAQEVTASGHTEAICGEVINEIPGKGWTDINGTKGGETIDISSTARGLKNENGDNFRKVRFGRTLTITAKDQTYTYNGQTQGEGDPAYDDPAVIAEKVTVDGLHGSDYLASIVLDGAATEVGEYRIEVSNAVIQRGNAKVTEEYDIIYVPGKLTIKDKDQPTPTPTPTPAKVSGTPLTQMTSKGKTGMTIAWEKTEGAEGYDVFFSRCNHDDKKMPTKIVATVNGNDVSSWTASDLKAGVTYKACVKAYVMKDGNKQYVKSSPLMHAYTAGASKKHCNAKSVKVNKKNVSIKKGKTFKLKAKVKKLKKGKTLMPKSHVAKVRYLSTDTSIATVSKKGKIKGVSAGTCYVYAYAHNGVFKKVTVTVR